MVWFRLKTRREVVFRNNCYACY